MHTGVCTEVGIKPSTPHTPPMDNPHFFLQCSDHARMEFQTNKRTVPLRIKVARTPGDIDEWLDAVRPTALGLDIEWKPVFQRNVPPNRASLLQLAFGDSALLIQLFYVSPLPPTLLTILADATIPKLGVGVLADVAKMHRDWGVVINGAQELGTGESLAKVAFAATGVKLSKKKKICRSNWQNRLLSPAQVAYAALDAWVAAEAYSSAAQPPSAPAESAGVVCSAPTQSAGVVLSAPAKSAGTTLSAPAKSADIIRPAPAKTAGSTPFAPAKKG